MRYLNFVLTVIAFCLVYQCVHMSARPAAGADGSPVSVRVVNSGAEAVPIELKRVSFSCGSVPVVVKNR